MASTYKIARMIVEEFEATEDYRSEDYARIMERVERAVRERYPDVTGEQWRRRRRSGPAICWSRRPKPLAPLAQNERAVRRVC